MGGASSRLGRVETTAPPVDRQGCMLLRPNARQKSLFRGHCAAGIAVGQASGRGRGGNRAIPSQAPGQQHWVGPADSGKSQQVAGRTQLLQARIQDTAKKYSQQHNSISPVSLVDTSPMV
jgi:hypothetical protein